jgi:glutaredoxin-like protein NrdH
LRNAPDNRLHKARLRAAQCDDVYRALDKVGIEYSRVDISTVPGARDFVMALGYLQAPVIYAGPTINHFSGFRPDRLKALAKFTAA